jgi:hypothetical protein
MQQQGIAFRQCKNAFLQCSDPQRLQQLADSLTAQDLLLRAEVADRLYSLLHLPGTTTG